MQKDTTETPLKYRIKEKINAKALTRVGQAELRKQITNGCGIVAETLSVWELYRVDDKGMIPADQLLIISKILGCTMEELFTPPTKHPALS